MPSRKHLKTQKDNMYIAIFIIYALLTLGCLVFLFSFKTRELLLSNALRVLMLGQAMAYVVQLYGVSEYMTCKSNNEIFGAFVMQTFYGKIPQIIGIVIFLIVYFSMNYRKEI